MQTRGGSKLSSKERKELFLDLCSAIATLQTSKEVADAFTDLLSAKEVETIAKRLQIAAYLVEGKDYQNYPFDTKSWLLNDSTSKHLA